MDNLVLQKQNIDQYSQMERYFHKLQITPLFINL